MAGNRTIVVMEDGKEVYRGPEQRHSPNVAVLQGKYLFGLSIDTWIKIAGFLLAVVLFYYRTDDFMKSQIDINKYMVKFAQNSDAYHSSQTGQLFEQGRPTSWNGGSGRRNNFSVVQPAHAAEGGDNDR